MSEDELRTALAAWRALDPTTSEAAVLEDRIIALGKAMGRPRIKAKRGEDIEELWHAIADEDDPADIDRLMDAPLAANASDAQKRLWALRMRPSDPRIALGLVRWVPTYTSSFRSAWLQSMVFARLRRPRSPRLERALEEMIDRLPDGEYKHSCLGELDLGLRSEAPRINLAPAAPPTHPTARVADLLAQHDADPGNLELRAVLGDALVEVGDPRGELIHVQLAIAAGHDDPDLVTRAAELIAKHADAWVDLPHVHSRRFERGVLAGVRCSLLDERMLASPAFRTVEELVVDRATYDVGPLLHRMPLLRTLEIGSLERAPIAAAGPFPQVRALALRDRAPLRGRHVFPNLEVLAGPWNIGLDAVGGDQRARQAYARDLGLRAIVYVGYPLASLDHAIVTRDAGPPETRFVVGWTGNVTFGAPAWRIAVPRTGVRARMAWVDGATYAAATTHAILASLAAGGIREVAVHVPAHAQAIERDIAAAVAGIGILAVDFAGAPIDLRAAI